MLPETKTQHDPDKIRADLGTLLDNITVLHNQILVVTYIRPEKTKGGIIRPASNLKEDEYQGKVGLVVKKGPLAFVDDERTSFSGMNVEVGEWISYRMSDGWQLVLNGYHCRMLEDMHVKLKVADPDVIF